jgi:hypothetical protein
MAEKCAAGTAVAGEGPAMVERLPDSSVVIDESAVVDKGADVGEGATAVGVATEESLARGTCIGRA